MFSNKNPVRGVNRPEDLKMIVIAMAMNQGRMGWIFFYLIWSKSNSLMHGLLHVDFIMSIDINTFYDLFIPNSVIEYDHLRLVTNQHFYEKVTFSLEIVRTFLV